VWIVHIKALIGPISDRSSTVTAPTQKQERVASIVEAKEAAEAAQQATEAAVAGLQAVLETQAAQVAELTQAKCVRPSVNQSASKQARGGQ